MWFTKVFEPQSLKILHRLEDTTGSTDFRRERILKSFPQAPRLAGKKRFQRSSLSHGICLEKGKVLVSKRNRNRGHEFLSNSFPIAQQVSGGFFPTNDAMLVVFYCIAKRCIPIILHP